MKAHLAALILFTTFAAALAAVPSVKFEPSKIDYAKKNSWDAVASKWMSSKELKNYIQDLKDDKKQVIFIDYNGAQYRGLFSDKVKYKGYYWMERHSQQTMSEDIAYYKKKGMEPSYIYRSGGGYTAVFVNPEQMEEARKVLGELGIGECTVKE